MPSNYGIDAIEPTSPGSSDYHHIHEQIADKNNDTISNQHSSIGYGTLLLTRIDDWYPDTFRYLFDKQLILSKPLNALIDSRHKKDYFPLSGKNANESQPPCYVQCTDGDIEITIKFEIEYEIPAKIDNCYLEIALLTVDVNGGHYFHTNKIQVNHIDIDVPDENPLLIKVTRQHLIDRKISFKLVIIKTLRENLDRIASLPLFNTTQPLNTSDCCESIEDLENTFSLSRARLAFSLGYITRQHQFIRFPNTTVMSDEFIEKTKPEQLPKFAKCHCCSYRFNIQETSSNNKKRSVSSSDVSSQVTSKRSKASN